MAKIIPFKAVLPKPEIAKNLVTNSYKTYKKVDLEKELFSNPFSFLNIIAPKYNKNQKKVERFKNVFTAYQSFKKKRHLIQDKECCMYVYQLKDSTKRTFTGLTVGISVADYKNRIIKKHEDTLSKREKNFKLYLETVQFKADPVLISYPDKKNINSIIAQEMVRNADLNFNTADAQNHQLWRVKNKSTIKALQNEFKAIQSLYIADGHHRSASSLLLSEAVKKNTLSFKHTSLCHYYMATLIPESQLILKEYNRLIKGLNGKSNNEILTSIMHHFEVTPTGVNFEKPKLSNTISMYMNGKGYNLQIKNRPLNSLTKAKLDTHILQEYILKPILGINNPRTDKRLSYSKDPEGCKEMKKMIDKGLHDIAFALSPITIEELKQIADENDTMPPKSTYIYPRLKSGLTIYEF